MSSITSQTYKDKTVVGLMSEATLNSLTNAQKRELANSFVLTEETTQAPQELHSYLPIGSIFLSSVILADACYHMLDGSNILRTGAYTSFASWFDAYDTIHNVPTCTIAEYESDMNTYGQCGKFVNNTTSSAITSGEYTVNAHSIKLPTITQFIAGTTDTSSIGVSQLDTFKSHGHSIYGNMRTGAQSSGTHYGISYSTGNNSIGAYLGYGETNGWRIGENGDTETKPKNVRYPYYIVLANKIQTETEVTITNALLDLDSRAKRDASNLNATDKQLWFNIFYPVNSIYETTNGSFNPNTEFGGTWTKIYEAKNLISVGSQVVYDYVEVAGSTTTDKLVGAYGQSLFARIFDYLDTPSGYHRAYRITAQAFNRGDGVMQVLLNNTVVTSGACTWSGSNFRNFIASDILPQSYIDSLPYDTALNYGGQGYNFYARATNSSGSIWNITVHGFFEEDNVTYKWKRTS